MNVKDKHETERINLVMDRFNEIVSNIELSIERKFDSHEKFEIFTNNGFVENLDLVNKAYFLNELDKVYSELPSTREVYVEVSTGRVRLNWY